MKNPSPIVRFDPNKVRDFSTIKVGRHTVRRSPLRGTNYTVYSTMLGEDVAGRQVSYPCVADCDRLVSAASGKSSAATRSAALLDVDLHNGIVEILRTKEMDNRQLCGTFGLVSTVMAPVLSMLISSNQIVRRGSASRPLYASSAK